MKAPCHINIVGDHIIYFPVFENLNSLTDFLLSGLGSKPFSLII